MLNTKKFTQFDALKIEKNIIFQNLGHNSYKDYQNYQKVQSKRTPFSTQINGVNSQPLKNNQQFIFQDVQSTNLEDLWNTIENQIIQNPQHVQTDRNGIEKSDQTYLSIEEYQQIFGQKCLQQQKQNKKIEEDIEECENFDELWQSLSDKKEEEEVKIQQSASHKITINTLETLQLQQNKQQNVQEPEISNFINPKEGNQINQVYDQSEDHTLKNLKIGKDFIIYDMKQYAINSYGPKTYSYLGFHESNEENSKFYLYDLQNKESLIECHKSKLDQVQVKSLNTNKKIQYQTQYCLKFICSKTKEHIATAFHKNLENGILYNLKLFNSFTETYGGSFCLIQITDGYIGSNCYCKTSAFLSQKNSTNQKLKMAIGVKNGFLIANMGVSGIKSAPYNCRLENTGHIFVFLLGLFDKSSDKFVVRIGEGLSPLVALALSVGRKRYIDSFKQQ